MRKILLIPILFFANTSVVLAQNVDCMSASNVEVFDFTGQPQTFTVPEVPGFTMSNIHIEAYGAEGGNGATGGNGSSGGSGGLGGFIEGDLPLPSPGTVLNIFVGGKGATPIGGFNGGGSGGSQNAGGGGGASDVRLNTADVGDRIITAGGGGGAGRAGCETNTIDVKGGNGGDGGNNPNGENGVNAPTPGGQAGGGQGAIGMTAGAAGVGCGGFLGQPGSNGNASTGQGGNGGNGQSCCCFSFGSIPAGGGGGGGAFPGGGGGGGSAGTTGCSGNDKGAGGGGAGGTSGTSNIMTNVAESPGVQAGNGQVKICYDLTPIPSATPSPIPSSSPNSSPIPSPGKNLAYTFLGESVGASSLGSPSLTQISADSDSVEVNACFNFKRSLDRATKKGVYGVLKFRSGGKKIAKGRVTKKSPCLVLTLTEKAEYKFIFRKLRPGKTTLKSKRTFFSVS